MAGGAIEEFGKLFRSHLLVAIQAPSHIHILLRPGAGHLAEVAVAGLTVHTGADMWLVAEINKIWHDRHRDPFKFRMRFGIFVELLQFGSVCLDVIVATQTLRPSRQTGGLAAGCPGMAIDTGDALLNVNRMVVGKRLGGCSLGDDKAKNSQAEDYDDNRRTYQYRRSKVFKLLNQSRHKVLPVPSDGIHEAQVHP